MIQVWAERFVTNTMGTGADLADATKFKPRDKSNQGKSSVAGSRVMLEFH